MEFHHIGVACADMAREAAGFAALGYRAEGPIYDDPVQGIRCQFLVGGGPRMELVSPLNDASTVVAGILRQRIKFYHTAYIVSELDAQLARLREQRGKVVVQASPAVAFDGRPIAFVMLPTGLLIELIQA